MIWRNRAHQCAKLDFWLLTFRLLLLKVYKTSAKKYGGVMSHDSIEWCKNWRKTNFMFQKWQEFCVDPSTQKSKKLHFDWSLLCKVYNVWPKKVQRSFLWWHRRVVQNLKKNWLVVRKMTWGIWQIFTKTIGSVKIGTLMGSFCSK